MKTFTMLSILVLAAGRLNGQPFLSVEKATKIAQTVLSTDPYKEHSKNFNLQKPKYDEDTKIWSFEAMRFPVTPGSAIYFFEIRDADGFIRVGSVSSAGFSRGSVKTFRMPSSIGKAIREIMRE